MDSCVSTVQQFKSAQQKTKTNPIKFKLLCYKFLNRKRKKKILCDLPDNKNPIRTVFKKRI